MTSTLRSRTFVFIKLIEGSKGHLFPKFGQNWSNHSKVINFYLYWHKITKIDHPVSLQILSVALPILVRALPSEIGNIIKMKFLKLAYWFSVHPSTTILQHFLMGHLTH